MIVIKINCKYNSRVIGYRHLLVLMICALDIDLSLLSFHIQGELPMVLSALDQTRSEAIEEETAPSV